MLMLLVCLFCLRISTFFLKNGINGAVCVFCLLCWLVIDAMGEEEQRGI